MNHWQAEEMIRLNQAERQRELEAIRLQNELNSSRANWTPLGWIAGNLLVRVGMDFGTVSERK